MFPVIDGPALKLQNKLKIYEKLLQENSNSILTVKDIEDRINKYEKSLNRLKTTKTELENRIQYFKDFINNILELSNFFL